MSKYRHIIFDADDTLIDFGADERRAFQAALADIPPSQAQKAPFVAGMTAIADIPPSDEQIVPRMRAYSLQNWEELGLNKVNDPTVRKRYHALTHTHVHALFEYAQREYAVADAQEAERIFFETLCLPAHPLEGALETVKALAAKFRVSIATNGLSQMQRARLTEFKPYLYKLFISEEMNTIKPAEEFGEIMLGALNARAEECLFVGDSLSSDIALANKLGMDAVWVSSEGRPLPEGVKVKGQIRTLKEIFKYI